MLERKYSHEDIGTVDDTFTNASRPNCSARDNDGFCCTLKPDHTTPHAAHNTNGRIINVWYNKKETLEEELARLAKLLEL
jgi:hypothetical protein